MMPRAECSENAVIFVMQIGPCAVERWPDWVQETED